MPHPLVQPTGRWMRDLISDETVVERVQAGETELFELLVRRHNQRLFRTIRSRVQDDDEAEEALQEAYVSAWRRLSTFEGRASFRTWITRVALRTAAEVVRRRRRATEVAFESGVEQSQEHAGDPTTRLDMLEMRSRIERAIQQLPEAQRTVFVLRMVEGLSTAEVAHDLSVTQASVKIRLFRARRRMAAQLTHGSETVVGHAWSFAGQRCDDITNAVMRRVMADTARE